MIDPVVNEILKQLRELAESFYENPCPDYASYRERVGKCNGLKEAIAITLSIYEKDDD